MNLKDIDEAIAYSTLCALATANLQSWLMIELDCNEAGSPESKRNAELMDEAEKVMVTRIAEKYPHIAALFTPERVTSYWIGLKIKRYRR